MNIDILNKFTTHLKNAVVAASDTAQEWGHELIHPEHLLYGMMRQKGSIAHEVLTKAGLTSDPVKEFIFEHYAILPPSIDHTEIQPQFSDNTKRALAKSGVVAQSYRHTYIGTEHLLFTLIEMDSKRIRSLLDQERVNFGELRQHLRMVLKSTSKFPDLTEIFESTSKAEEKEKGGGKTPSLDYFCTELTSDTIQRTIDPVIGRKGEIDRLIHILSRRTKNNPVLIGDPGVGKTAIVEGLAKRILEGSVPEALQGKRMLSLDLGLVVAGTMYRGEFEGRFKQILDEIRNDPDTILFIDELHTIIGTGGASGSLDAANILKPALARGEVRCIGATTMEEYRKYIESDAALERRFQSILVDEPTAEETIGILKGVRKNYEAYHHVRITDDAIEAAVELSTRYMQEKFLPDKAIDLIDEAASKRKVETMGTTAARQLRKLREAASSIEHDKRDAVGREDFTEALRMKHEQEEIRKRIDKLAQKRSTGTASTNITRKDIADVVARLSGIPVQDMLVEEKQRLLDLESALKKRIVGQDDILSTIAQYIRRARAGLSDPNRPLGSFMFLGPSGVGKTELARVIAEEVFGSPAALVRIDMSEFSEGFQASKLIGAPAGYVGYKDGGKLTEPVRRKPYSVVLLDEIEKAHPDIFNLFLQVFDDGQITDATGKKINFRNTIVIMTSNVGVESLDSISSIGFNEGNNQQNKREDFVKAREKILEELKDHFRLEFLNRIDGTLVFAPLSPASLRAIVSLKINELNNRLTEQGVSVKLDRSAITWVAEHGSSPDQGARAIQQVIRDAIENPLAERLLKDGNLHGVIKVTANNNTLRFT